MSDQTKQKQTEGVEESIPSSSGSVDEMAPQSPVEPSTVEELPTQQSSGTFFGFVIDLDGIEQRDVKLELAELTTLAKDRLLPSWIAAVTTEIPALLGAIIAITQKRVSGLLRMLIIGLRISIKSIFKPKNQIS